EGKPSFTPEFSGHGLHFNLAHSSDLAVIAIARRGPLGVDVERIRTVREVEDLVARFFCARENEQFQKLPEAERPGAFFNLWTRKEALLKATGEGIGHRLNQVEVSFLRGEPARLISISGDARTAAEWFLSAFAPADRFVGAVAIQSPELRIRCWR